MELSRLALLAVILNLQNKVAARTQRPGPATVRIGNSRPGKAASALEGVRLLGFLCESHVAVCAVGVFPALHKYFAAAQWQEGEMPVEEQVVRDQ